MDEEGRWSPNKPQSSQSVSEGCDNGELRPGGGWVKEVFVVAGVLCDSDAVGECHPQCLTAPSDAVTQ